jgi:hypothetical protein
MRLITSPSADGSLERAVLGGCSGAATILGRLPGISIPGCCSITGGIGIGRGSRLL